MVMLIAEDQGQPPTTYILYIGNPIWGIWDPTTTFGIPKDLVIQGKLITQSGESAISKLQQ